MKPVLLNPYESVDWNRCSFVHSMSHQHCNGTPEECELLARMGYTHFAFSNYYPSRPLTALPEEWADRHPEVVCSPNAEHHSFTDSPLHANGLGSLFASGSCDPMLGTGKPWREIFDAILNGKLKYPDGGGITLNHPAENAEHYLPMLDYDERVLGIEVWTQRTGFGVSRRYYDLWDTILASSRRCWGFFVKDHRIFGRGRNVLLLPDVEQLTAEQKEHETLRAYRNGAFFGLVGAKEAVDFGDRVYFCDKGDFRFARIELCGNNLEVEVAGNEATCRRNVEIRFISAKGIIQQVNGRDAALSLEMEVAKLLEHKFFRIEAFAYPDTDEAGEPLRERISAMDVVGISALSRKAPPLPQAAPSVKELSAYPWNAIGFPEEPEKSIPLVDMLFSQPLMVRESDA